MNIPAAAVSSTDWDKAVAELIVAARSIRAVHRPLLLLYLFGRCQRKEPAEVSFVEVEKALTPVLERFRRGKKAEVLLPFWHLQSAPFWEIPNGDDFPRRKGKDRPTRATLVRANALGRVRPSWWAGLAEHELLSELGERILQELWLREEERDIVAELVQFKRLRIPVRE